MGYLDAETGIYIYDEDDDEATFSELLNLGQNSTSDQVGTITKATDWTGFKLLAGLGAAWGEPSSGARGEIRRIGKRVYLRGSFNNNTAYTSIATVGTVPYGYRPNTTAEATTDAVAYFPVISGGSAVAKQIRIFCDTGALGVYASAGATGWYFDGISWETDDAWPEV